ncbi:PREDICTED: uncharacterized protein LOC105449478 [Wasmannia auropunctata]|uniref:uncharacterized protein LOC105449478 n=1 Tax=Wasmannia auropunctata TaxID=64793 RepID=UPI0005F05ED4|nr:PREDICTED: uncharacterized protein LOC105449478 [Wasmannia auropunctata]
MICEASQTTNDQERAPSSAGIKKGNKRTFQDSETASTSTASGSRESAPSHHSEISIGSNAGSNSVSGKANKTRKIEEKANTYTASDLPPYAVHVHALGNSRNSMQHPVKIFAQVGQSLPTHVTLFWARHEVHPYIPKARVCYSCYRAGHVSAACRSQPRCIYCGNAPHGNDVICPLKEDTPCCINCSGEHLPVNPKCPLLENQRKILTLSAAQNIPLAEAKKRLNTPPSPTLGPGFSSQSPTTGSSSAFAVPTHNRFEALNGINNGDYHSPGSQASYAQIAAGLSSRQHRSQPNHNVRKSAASPINEAQSHRSAAEGRDPPPPLHNFDRSPPSSSSGNGVRFQPNFTSTPNTNSNSNSHRGSSSPPSYNQNLNRESSGFEALLDLLNSCGGLAFYYDYRTSIYRKDVDFCMPFGQKESSPSEVTARFQEYFAELPIEVTAFYTDGSKSDKSSMLGSSVYSPSLGFTLCEKLPSASSTFTAEAWAILQAVNACFDFNIENAVIFSDSKSVLETLASLSCNHSNHVIHQIKHKLSLAESRKMSIILCWIPAHKGIGGNEKADRLAKHAAANSRRPFFKVPYPDLQVEAKEHRFASFREYLESTALVKGTQYSEIYKDYSDKTWFHNKGLKREEIYYDKHGTHMYNTSIANN